MYLIATIIAIYLIVNNPFFGILYGIWKIFQILKPENIYMDSSKRK